MCDSLEKTEQMIHSPLPLINEQIPEKSQNNEGEGVEKHTNEPHKDSPPVRDWNMNERILLSRSKEQKTRLHPEVGEKSERTAGEKKEKSPVRTKPANSQLKK